MERKSFLKVKSESKLKKALFKNTKSECGFDASFKRFLFKTAKSECKDESTDELYVLVKKLRHELIKNKSMKNKWKWAVLRFFDERWSKMITNFNATNNTVQKKEVLTVQWKNQVKKVLGNDWFNCETNSLSLKKIEDIFKQF